MSKLLIIRNMILNGLKRRNLLIMGDKLVMRFRERHRESELDRVRVWCRDNAANIGQFLGGLDDELWQEALTAGSQLELTAQQKLRNLSAKAGGGGNYTLLYFLSRLLRPLTVVETGVAAGWSSQAILMALARNDDGGKLYSSDFPYFRQEDPTKLIGCLVEDEFRTNWTLLIDGDRYNLPKIVEQVRSVDLFHYDSDKSYRGRQFAFETMAPKLGPASILVFDDVQDNFHFRDLVSKQSWQHFVCEFQGKYVGITGPGFKKLRDPVSGAC